MTFGLLLTDAELWSAMGDQLRRRADETGERIRYEFDPLSAQRGSDHLQRGRNSDWGARLTSLLAGVGLGIGVGIFLAPASGDEMRAAFRNRMSGVKTTLREKTNRPPRFGEESRYTGTEGD